MAAGYPEDQILLTDYEDKTNPFGPRPNDLGRIGFTVISKNINFLMNVKQ